MTFTLRKSAIEKSFYEVWEEGRCVQEIPIRFPIRRIPAAFETLEEIRKWLEETEWKLARGYAYRKLAMRNFASGELEKALKTKGFSSSVCGRLFEELTRLGYLNDEETLKSAVLREFKRGYGPKYIEAKLCAKGLNGSRAREWISDPMQIEKIGELLRKLARGSGFSARQKAIQALGRRGFDFHLILSAVQR
jgi:SOS response regulatory protein OraA/RecX